jgi:hypothetical protein
MRTAVWQGFDHYWALDPHRLNVFGSHIHAGEDAAGEHNVVYHSRMSIGRFPPDECHTSTIVHEVGTPTTGMFDGAVTVEAAGMLGRPAEIAGERVCCTLPRPDLTAEVTLRGFDIETVNFRHGFHIRGFGFSIDDVEHNDEGIVSFTPRFFISPAQSPDPATDPNRLIWMALPWPAAVEPRRPDDYVYRLTLYYRILYDEPGKMVARPQQIIKVARSHDYPVRMLPARPPAEASGIGGGEYDTATIALTGFRWELRNWPNTRFQGRYLRKLKFTVENLLYDPETGEMTYQPKMVFTNYGVRGRRQDRRERRRRWAVFLRSQAWPQSNRVRALSRLLRGSYGFLAQYTLHTSLLQFRGGHQSQPQTMQHVIRSERAGSRVAISLLRAIRIRGWRAPLRLRRQIDR